jgi:hypothetical protein
MLTKSRKNGMLKHFLSRIDRKPRGQSFVELMLVVSILMLILAGVVEFGFLLNNYLHVLDGTREAARFSNTSVAFDPKTYAINELFYYYTAVQAANTMEPIRLDPAKGDDIIVSVLSVAGTSVVRRPSATGWSLCANYTGFVDYFWTNDPNHPIDPLQSVSAISAGLADPNWYSCPVHASHLSDADIQARLDANAPNAGVLIVEILYNYPQLLKLPVFSNFLPDPILTYVYTIMPISSAEPK